MPASLHKKLPGFSRKSSDVIVSVQRETNTFCKNTTLVLHLEVATPNKLTTSQA
jgi:hypothetical protein